MRVILVEEIMGLPEAFSAYKAVTTCHHIAIASVLRAEKTVFHGRPPILDLPSPLPQFVDRGLLARDSPGDFIPQPSVRMPTVVVEFDRLHAAPSRKEGAGERSTERAARDEGAESHPEKAAGVEESSTNDGDDRSDGGDGGQPPSTGDSSPSEEETAADRKTRQAIERALCENWGYREVKRYVDKVIAALGSPAAPNKGGRPRVPFKWSRRRLQVDVDHVGALDASQKHQLRTVIQEILTKL